MSDQLKRLNMLEQTAAQLRKTVVEYLRVHPTTPDGNHLREFVSHRAWDTYQKKSTPGTWGDWIVLWGLVNMLSVEVALVSSLGQNALRIISPDSSKNKQDIGSRALLGHEAEYHYQSLESVVSTRSPQSAVDFMADRYGKGEVTEEYCTKCGKKYQSVSSGIHVSEGGCVQYYCDDQEVCDLCQYMETHPDVME